MKLLRTKTRSDRTRRYDVVMHGLEIQALVNGNPVGAAIVVVDDAPATGQITVDYIGCEERLSLLLRCVLRTPGLPLPLMWRAAFNAEGLPRAVWLMVAGAVLQAVFNLLFQLLVG